jgi:hypothetical protein
MLIVNDKAELIGFHGWVGPVTLPVREITATFYKSSELPNTFISVYLCRTKLLYFLQSLE